VAHLERLPAAFGQPHTAPNRLDPRYGLAFLWRGNAYYNKLNYDRAITDFNKAIRLDPPIIYC
jgi:tetratricopeptide (TPR) repeat protein